MAVPTRTYSFTCGALARASEMSTNFNDWVDGATDGEQDYVVSQLACAGAVSGAGSMHVSSTVSFVTSVRFGTASGHNITTVSDALPVSATAYDLGSASAPWGAHYVTSALAQADTPETHRVYINMMPKAFGMLTSAGVALRTFNVSSISNPSTNAWKFNFHVSLTTASFAAVTFLGGTISSHTASMVVVQGSADRRTAVLVYGD